MSQWDDNIEPMASRLLRGRRRMTVLVLAAALFVGSATVRAISTDPVLVLSRASAVSGVSERIVRLEGTFPAEDLVQVPFALQILLRETTTGTQYVRWDISQGVFSGTAPELADGLQFAEVLSFSTQGVPTQGGDLVLLARDRIELRIPNGFPDGPAEAALFTIYEGSPILSNALTFVVGEAP